MRFERGKDIKEVLKIGRKARATRVSGYYILGKVEYDDGWISENMGFSTTDKEGTRKMLKYYEKGRRPAERLVKELFLDHIKRGQRILKSGHPFTVDKDFNMSKRIFILDCYIQVIGEYSPIVGNVYGRKPYELKGEDLVHEGILYTVPEYAV